MTYQITFHMEAPLCFIDRPIFDSILAHCWMREKYGRVPQKLYIPPKELETFAELPLVRHRDGYFLASLMFFEEDLEFVPTWKKRWHSGDDYLVEFGRGRRRIDVQQGAFKSYSVPLDAHSIPQVWFYFASEDVEAVGQLIDRHLVGFGKKVKQGYGFFSHYTITPSERSFENELLRPVPVKTGDMYTPEQVRYCGWRIPYWLPENMAICFYPPMGG